MDSLSIGLVLAAFSAATILAYQRPKAFEGVFFLAILVCSAILITAIAWDVASNKTYWALGPYIAKEKLQEALKVSDEGKLFSQSDYIVLLLAIAYLYVLRYLLPIFRSEDEGARK